MTTPNFIIDVMLSLTLEEITELKKLSIIKKQSLEDCARDCMNDQCKYLLGKQVKPDLVETIEGDDVV